MHGASASVWLSTDERRWQWLLVVVIAALVVKIATLILWPSKREPSLWEDF